MVKINKFVSCAFGAVALAYSTGAHAIPDDLVKLSEDRALGLVCDWGKTVHASIVSLSDGRALDGKAFPVDYDRSGDIAKYVGGHIGSSVDPGEVEMRIKNFSKLCAFN